MTNHRNENKLGHREVASAVAGFMHGREEHQPILARPDEYPRLRVQTVEGVAIVRFEGIESLFEESGVRAVRDQLNRLIEQGHIRLLVNFTGVRYLTSDVLGILAALQQRIAPARGRIQLCGLDPLLRDMLRITHLDGMFDIFADEAESLENQY
jgi:anti-sigma B factor antagonist